MSAKYSLDNLPEGITPRDLRMVERYDRLSKLYGKRATLLKDRIKAAFGPVNTALGGVIIKTATVSSVDAEAFAKAHPFATHPQYYKTVLDVKSIPAEARKGYVTTDLRTSVAASE